MKRAKRKKKPTLARRTWSIYRHQRQRANKAGQTIPYSLDDLREVVRDHLEGEECPYCTGPLHILNFSVDHARPLSRGGGWDIDNLCVCCRRCNEGKGNMTGREWRQLRDLIGEWEEAPGRLDVLRRLRAGGARARGKQ